MTQAELAQRTGINRSMIGRLENQSFTPSVAQLEALAEVLDFEVTELYAALPSPAAAVVRPHRIAVAGTGYVGLSIAVLLAQHNHVTAVDILPEKVACINSRKSPVQDAYIEKYLPTKPIV